ncbi:hypothetical protein [Pseudonocardia alni]|uniref:hypothetical protein n=1 Tax=Pseudonocardia alni TaxID=33907 RepID=UPI00280AD5AC|nr:hypothetical protein [Pseudonocardia alni]
MAIHRASRTPSRPAPRVDLGKVLVTIDDLEALMQIMDPQEPAAGEPVVRFGGGHFTDANGMRSLSDYEVDVLYVNARLATVSLTPTSASASCEDEGQLESIRAWARARQTKLTPAGTVSPPRFALWGLLALAFASGILALFCIFGPDSVSQDEATLRFALSIVSGGFSVILLIVWLAGRYFVALLVSDKNYAVIEPRTMAEFRDRQKSDHRPRQANIITGAGAGVAVAAAIIGVWAIFAPK